MNEEGINNWLSVLDNVKIIGGLDTHCSNKISMRKNCLCWTKKRLKLEEGRKKYKELYTFRNIPEKPSK